MSCAQLTRSQVATSSCVSTKPAIRAQQLRATAIKGQRVVVRGVRRGAPVKRALSVRAEEIDFDAILAKAADKWEKSDKKVPVIGYSVATLVAIILIEKIVHFPVLNVLLGIPLELVGVFSTVFLGVRYVKEKKDPLTDVDDIVGKITAELPGFK